jgi:hypothetical protein
MAEGMTKTEWERLLPARPVARQKAVELSARVQEMKSKRAVEVQSIVGLHTAWPGVIELDQETQAQLTHRVGRWCVLDNCMICLSEGGMLTTDFLDEDDCFYHFLKKSWLYDPSDLLFAMEFARGQFFPHEEPAQRLAAIDRQLQYAIEHRRLLFHPNALRHKHLYLVNCMTPDDERVAFCQFLADKGYTARDWAV